MTTLKTLYKTDSKGKIREWRMEIDGDRYRTIAGLADGEQVTSGWTQVKGKNAGRANETTAEQQAAAEVNAKYTKKLKESYHPTMKTVAEAVIFAPMLAQGWEKRRDKIKWGEERVFNQPKLDGIRCIAMVSGLWSRKGTPITAVPHIYESLMPRFEQFPGLVLDGELYNHELKADFSKIVSLVRKKSPTADQLRIAKDMVEYHVYDIASPDLIDKPFIARSAELSAIFAQYPTPGIVVVPTTEVRSREESDEAYARDIEAGYEGGIVRLNAPYKNARSNDLVKRKDFDDEEFTIIRVEEGQGNWAGVAKRVIFRNDQDHLGAIGTDEVGAGLKGSKDYARHVLENAESYIGKQVTVTFFGRSGDEKGAVPRFPIAKQLHEDTRW